MATSSTEAFGRYLRILRERKGLSLDEVDSLSRVFPDPVHKAYLSRVENGKHRIAFSKVIHLARIYEVPPEVLVEKMELDLELERIGGPDTEGKSFQELTASAKDHSAKGRLWDCYAVTRDALPTAVSSPVSESFRDRTEQVLGAHMNFGSAAGKHGKYQLALHEFRYVESQDGLGPRNLAVLLDRLAVYLRIVGRVAEGADYADRAISVGEEHALDDLVGYLYHNRGMLARDLGNSEDEVAWYQKAHDAQKAAGNEEEVGAALINLGFAYLDLKKNASSRRALMAAEKRASDYLNQRQLCRIRLGMGDIEASEGNGNKAEKCWRAALEIAKQEEDTRYRFIAEYRLFCHAAAKGDDAVVRAIDRRLKRLANKLPASMEEVQEYRRSRVVASQQGPDAAKSPGAKS